MSEQYIGEIRMFGGNFAPKYWAFCHGQLLPIVQENAALFSILGTIYGGDGVNTFALPDLRGRVPISAGQHPGGSSYALGQANGTESVTLLTPNLPAHTHTAALASGAVTVSVAAAGVGATTGNPVGNVLAQSQQPARPPVSINSYADAAAFTGQLGGVNVGGTGQVTVGLTGDNAPVSIMQPYQAVNFIIAIYGIFPSRN